MNGKIPPCPDPRATPVLTYFVPVKDGEVGQPQDAGWEACHPRPFRQDIFDHFMKNHSLILLASEMEDVARVVNAQLCAEKTVLINENAELRRMLEGCQV